MRLGGANTKTSTDGGMKLNIVEELFKDEHFRKLLRLDTVPEVDLKHAREIAEVVLGRPVKNWRDIALHLADCQAATTFDFTKKSASKNEASRHISICETALESIQHEYLNRSTVRDPEAVLEHLRSAKLAVARAKGL
jgi:hypothetical protein